MYRFKLATSATAAGCALVALSACTSSSPKVSSADYTVRIALTPSGNNELDPAVNASSANADINMQWGDTLVGISPSGKLAPSLAVQWSHSANLKTWTFDLRHGVKFQNGDPFTANDVKFSLDRYASPSATSPFASALQPILSSVKVVNKYTVQVLTTTPQAELPALLSDQANQGIILDSKYLLENAGTSFSKQSALLNKHPIGTGPFAFQSQVLGTSITFVRAKQSWHPTPAITKLVFDLVPDPTTQVNMLLSHQVDIISIDPDNVRQVTAAGMQVRRVDDADAIGLLVPGLNRPSAKGKPTENVLVREALSLAINRRVIIKDLLDGYGTLPTTPYDTTPSTEDIDVSHFASWAKQVASYDPAKAKQLLAEAGYPKGFTGIKLYTFPRPEDPGLEELAQEIADEWQAIGVDVQIVETDYDSYRPHLIHPSASDSYNAGDINTWAIGTRFDNYTPLFGYYASNGSSQLAVTNVRQIDSAITALQAEPNAAKRMQMTSDVWDEIDAQWTVIPLFNAPQLYAVNPKTVGTWTDFTAYPYLAPVLATAQRP